MTDTDYNDIISWNRKDFAWDTTIGDIVTWNDLDW